MAINRDKLIKEFLELERLWQPHQPRHDEIRATLLEDAKGGDGYKIVIANLGQASISAPHDEECTGEEPRLVPEKYLALVVPERRKLTKSGLVEVVEVWKKAYGGRVTTKLF